MRFAYGVAALRMTRYFPAYSSVEEQVLGRAQDDKIFLVLKMTNVIA
jgi:hypothetical protein